MSAPYFTLNPRSSWCGVAGPAFTQLPTLALVRANQWSPISFALRGLGFVQSSVPRSSSWSLPACASRPVWRVSAARRAARLFGFGFVVFRPSLSLAGVWSFYLSVRA